MLDRRTDSLFDIMRLRLRSSIRNVRTGKRKDGFLRWVNQGTFMRIGLLRGKPNSKKIIRRNIVVGGGENRRQHDWKSALDGRGR
ncbi:hypothetical protein L2E82_30423 [Cichorium intybus]|uniref:Uncharacterized protein n=1 Tax=Cichorium intybus TaxID=13427 RepID=A0ACB9D115_CICIN|nr:hypothetical protein L2E82_30423 [Cichorium intybus]